MSASHGDSVLTVRISRLLSHARALKASGLIDKDAAVQMVNLATATKAFCDALDWLLAIRCLEEINKVADDLDVADVTAVSSATHAHVKAVRERIPKAA